MSEETKEPPQAIDPLPVLGDVLNHMDRVLWTTGTLVVEIMEAIRKQGIVTPGMVAAEQDMINAFRVYSGFKEQRPAGDGDDEPT